MRFIRIWSHITFMCYIPEVLCIVQQTIDRQISNREIKETSSFWNIF